MSARRLSLAAFAVPMAWLSGMAAQIGFSMGNWTPAYLVSFGLAVGAIVCVLELLFGGEP